MKKILSLALVTILLITSVFTGYVVSAVMPDASNIEIPETGWDDYGVTVDASLFTGMWQSTAPLWWDTTNGAKSTTVPTSNEGARYYKGNLTDGFTQFKTASSLRTYAPCIALNAGKTGLAGDNALIFGMPVAGVSKSVFYIYNRNYSGDLVIGANPVTVKFDIKVLSGTVSGAYVGVTTWATSAADQYGVTAQGNTYTTKPVEGSTATDHTAFQTGGYDGSYISNDWTTLYFTVDANTGQYNYLYFSFDFSGDTGAVFLLDNIQIIKGEENILNAHNFCPIAITRDKTTKEITAISPYTNPSEELSDADRKKGGAELYVNEYFGTFDTPNSAPVTSVVDPSVTYIPTANIGYGSATVAPVLSEAGEGVNGGYAMNMAVNANNVNTVKFKAYNPSYLNTWHCDSSTYRVSFKARVKTGTVDSLKLGLLTECNYGLANANTIPEYAALQTSSTNAQTSVTTYAYKNITDYRINLASTTSTDYYAEKELTSEWKQFTFFVTSAKYTGRYVHLVIDLTGADSTTVIQIDDIVANSVAADGTVSDPIYICAAMDPSADSTFDFGKVIEYDLASINSTEKIVVVPEAGHTVNDFIANLNLSNALQWGCENQTYMFSEFPDETKFNPQYNNKSEWTHDSLDDLTEAFAGDATISTGNVLILRLVSGLTGKVYDQFTVAVKNDVNGDGLVNAVDLVRAKRYILDIETVGEPSDAQLAAAGVTEDGDNITITEVGYIRADLMK